MRLLLTSGGIANPSIRTALDALLPKPIDECNALCIPTAIYGHPHVGPGGNAWRFVSGNEDNVMTQLDWASMGLLELTALPSIDRDRWVPLVLETDVFLVGGGDALYLAHWLRESGFVDLMPELDQAVWVGLSAGSMVMTPRIGDYFVEWPSAPDDQTLGIVDFSIFPHLDYPGFAGNTMVHAQRWAADIAGPSYAIDDATALKVVDGAVEVVSEGQWKQFSH